MLLLFIVWNTQYQISVRAGVYKNWALEPSEFLKKRVLLAEKLCSKFVHLKQIIIKFF